jgi:hypothetical protein
MTGTQRDRDDIDAFVTKAVVRMLHLKLKTGSSPASLRSFVAGCAREAARLHRIDDSDAGFDIYEIAGVMRTWHTETRFLDQDGMPKALKLAGRAGLRGLVATHFPPKDFPAVLNTLKSSGLIKRASRSSSWQPAERHARVPKATTEILRHLAEGISRFAETVTRNTEAGRGGDLLFERGCKVFQLPIADARAFREHVQKQGTSFITAVDDWLESRVAATKNSKKKRCVAGAFAFGFIDDQLVDKRATRLRSSHPPK